MTLRAVNHELVKRGIHAILRKGEGFYFYFSGGETGEWWDRTVQAPRIGSLSLDQWVEAYQELKRKNDQIMAMGKPGANAKKGRRQRAGKAGG